MVFAETSLELRSPEMTVSRPKLRAPERREEKRSSVNRRDRSVLCCEVSVCVFILEDKVVGSDK